MKSSHHNGADISQQFGLILCVAGKEKVSNLPTHFSVLSMSCMASGSHDGDARKCAGLLS